MLPTLLKHVKTRGWTHILRSLTTTRFAGSLNRKSKSSVQTIKSVKASTAKSKSSSQSVKAPIYKTKSSSQTIKSVKAPTSAGNESQSFKRTLYADGYVYEGAWKEGIWAGQGTLTSATGQLWKGVFKDGKIYNGSGMIVFPDGDTYEGKWVKGKMEGKGHWTQSNGSYLQGEFKEDNFYDGVGVLVHPDGTVSQGTWKAGALAGELRKYDSLKELKTISSVHEVVDKTIVSKVSPKIYQKPKELPKNYREIVNPDGSILRGEFKKGVIFNGSGVWVKKSGEVWEGTWVNGKMEGQGKRTWKTGTVYVGEFVNNRQHGQGKYISSLGQVFEGEFKKDERFKCKSYFIGEIEGTWVSGDGEGQCELLNDDGTVLKGEFTEGKIYNGSGVMKYVNGTVLEGTWVDGCMEGKGKIIYSDKGVYVGELQRGLKQGHGIYTSQYGDLYEGEFCNNMRCGQGKNVTHENRIIEGTWKDGHLHGLGKEISPDGNVVEGEFRDGKCYNCKGAITRQSGVMWAGEWKEGILYGTITYSNEVTISGKFSRHELLAKSSKENSI